MEIDCSIPCPVYLKMLNSCPSKQISFLSLEWENIFELIMVALSISPYAISFLFLIGTTYYKTTRGVVLFVMIFAQNLIIEFLKGSLRDPRPNFKCNQQFGNPSNHATFYTSLMAWIIMEHLMLEKKFRFSNWMIKIMLFISYPFILYSRIYLNYHSQEQITNGIILGIFMGIAWFIIVDSYILKKDNPLRRVMFNLRLNNTLSNENFNLMNDYENESALYRKFMNLTEKQEELARIKNELKGFRQNVENLDFMKNAKNDIKNFKKKVEKDE